jgi:hypothetical protein
MLLHLSDDLIRADEVTRGMLGRVFSNLCTISEKSSDDIANKLLVNGSKLC